MDIPEKKELEKYAIYMLLVCVIALAQLLLMQLGYAQNITKNIGSNKALTPQDTLHSTTPSNHDLNQPISGTLRIAVAANFRATLDKLIADYQTHYGQDANFTISSASTGVLYAQIKQGAPYDLFFSADKKTAQQLAKELNIENNAFHYAQGVLSFWCPNGSPTNLTELAKWQGTFAMANPKLAPYGIASEEVIKKLSWKHNRTIMGNNVAQVAQFVTTKNVTCGFIAKALLPQNLLAYKNTLSYSNAQQHLSEAFTVPASWYHPIEQYAVKLPRGAKQPLTEHFSQYVQDQGREIIQASGYELPLTAFNTASNRL